jgi:hypothetical protein
MPGLFPSLPKVSQEPSGLGQAFTIWSGVVPAGADCTLPVKYSPIGPVAVGPLTLKVTVAERGDPLEGV